MSETLPSGNICIVPKEIPPDLPLKYYMQYEMELLHLVLLRIGDQLEFNADVDRLVAVIERERANKYQAKTNKVRERHRQIYKEMCTLDKIYKDDWELKKPNLHQYAEHLANRGFFGYNGKPYKERVLREIKKLGNEKRL